MSILIMMAYIEIIIVILALMSNSLFTFMLYQASSLHFNCRNLLFSFSISMFLLTISHGLTVFEFLYEDKTFEYIYFVSPRGTAWRLIHEFGYGLQSMSLLLFSVERLMSSACPTGHTKSGVKSIFALLTVLSILFSMWFSYVIHVRNVMFVSTVAMNVVDVSGCVILIFAWKRSLLRYRATIGVFSLEQRFQLSEVYNWSRHLIPAVLLASLTKFIVIVLIWILITGEYKGNEAAFLVSVYNNVLNLYTVVMPFVILLKHHKIRQKLLHTSNQKSVEMKTIDGKEIPRKHDYFEFLKQNWA
uniref:G protein-coupled receptor n=1 Tax=Caenorhabditis tropicalis TaxID=1561998 RepID=A0A1I7T8B3_9PELO